MNNMAVEPRIRVFCDFDGTITRKDSGDEFFKTFGLFDDLHGQLMSGAFTVSEYYNKICATLQIPSKEALSHFIETCEVDAYFSQFIEFIREQQWDCIIVSDGFDAYITPILERMHVHDVKLYCNNLLQDPEHHAWTPKFPNADERCSCFCASCKKKVVLGNTHPDDLIVYIGDGMSDTCPVHVADMVFAKGTLARYCNQHGIVHHNWNSFFDILAVLKKRSPMPRDVAIKERRKAYIAE